MVQTNEIVNLLVVVNEQLRGGFKNWIVHTFVDVFDVSVLNLRGCTIKIVQSSGNTFDITIMMDQCI